MLLGQLADQLVNPPNLRMLVQVSVNLGLGKLQLVPHADQVLHKPLPVRLQVLDGKLKLYLPVGTHCGEVAEVCHQSFQWACPAHPPS
ncbi:hypothetical protein [Cyanobium sp. ATX 6F1]|uniref:hypothetical protein n=1 Tax=Cyanobium sp. ATX 6F1 TaxID=2823702 RepID=UPI0020CF9003|nr:hypothetical protein [Cyanobium sp. ATX 6F1]MCP9917209.1 hypothetical protein [Cyanobium sp. ATX 6F1]